MDKRLGVLLLVLAGLLAEVCVFAIGASLPRITTSTPATPAVEVVQREEVTLKLEWVETDSPIIKGFFNRELGSFCFVHATGGLGCMPLYHLDSSPLLDPPKNDGG